MLGGLKYCMTMTCTPFEMDIYCWNKMKVYWCKQRYVHWSIFEGRAS